MSHSALSRGIRIGFEECADLFLVLASRLWSAAPGIGRGPWRRRPERRSSARSVVFSLPRSKCSAMPRTLSFCALDAFGSPPPIEKRPITPTGTLELKCGAFDRLAASAVGTKLPLKQMPCVCAARTPSCLPKTALSALTRLSASASAWAGGVGQDGQGRNEDCGGNEPFEDHGGDPSNWNADCECRRRGIVLAHSLS